MGLVHLDKADGCHEWLTDEQLAVKYPGLHAVMNRPRPYEEEGRELRNIRVEMRFTLREVANRLGLKPSELSDIERGVVQPTDKIKLDYKLIEQHGL
jgi:DNA-binding XRE family transcriptional regulator